ncbi:XRE family transcriptional regulator [Flavobacterium bomense]|uniref:XRE family transcriptional regulator n=1 Tax=Flavobacterium bomense TaxID=2497483 RepID=A0A3S0MFP5_9FLAO|nr:helix-turn-helix transcriptional regulator [Flavobacterium bomense]RTZ02039.1 XRE family transcriptional regulator [Flavobacterium bomense]
MNKKTYYNIRKIREMNDLTRDYVAGELQMSTSGYGKIERGEIDLTISKLYKIAAVLGVSITDLLFFDVSTLFKNNVNETSVHQASPEANTFFDKEQVVNLENVNQLPINKNR